VRFYVISDRTGAVVECTTSLRAAMKCGREQCGGVFDVDLVTTPPPSRELVRLLLANSGGYADDSVRLIENGKPYNDPSAAQEDSE
jgi:hypothetical protein